MRKRASERGPDCNSCQSFFITHDPKRRYGCRAFGMKSQALPSVEVLRTSGNSCQLFEAKTPPKSPPGSATGRQLHG